MLFSLWVVFAAGYQAVCQAMLLPIGISSYAILKARREGGGDVVKSLGLTGLTGLVVPTSSVQPSWLEQTS